MHTQGAQKVSEEEKHPVQDTVLKNSTNLVTINESESEVAQSCLTLCDPMDCSLSGFSVHGIFQVILVKPT